MIKVMRGKSQHSEHISEIKKSINSFVCNMIWIWALRFVDIFYFKCIFKTEREKNNAILTSFTAITRKSSSNIL